MNWYRELRRRLVGPKPRAKAVAVDVAVATHVGCVRDANEDSVLFTRVQKPTLLATRGVIAVVADGMGGANSGEVASTLACETISQVYFKTPGNPGEALNTAFQLANQRIFSLVILAF